MSQLAQLCCRHQEIEKLLLLHGTGSINAEQLASAVADSARYDVFELVDSALRGETGRCLRILGGLKGEGVAVPVVLWALHREIATIAGISASAAKGLSVDHAMTRAKVWAKRKPLVRNAIQHLKTPSWLALLAEYQQAEPQPRALTRVTRGYSWSKSAPASALPELAPKLPQWHGSA